MKRVPNLGDTILVRHPDAQLYGVAVLAAIVTNVHNENIVDVTAFPPGGVPKTFQGLSFSDDSTRSGWFWRGEASQSSDPFKV